MTALLGRVPIDGKVTDPYPFKVLIGKDNLTANGIQLPDVEGRLSQERQPATGRSPACGAMCKASPSFFQRRYGSYRSQPAKSTDGSDNKTAAAAASAGCRMKHGVPCLAGERKSNASTYLPTLFALSGATAAAEAMAEGEMTSSTEGTT